MHQGLRMRGLEFYKGEVDKYQREYEVRLILLLHRHFKLHYKDNTLGRENIYHTKKGLHCGPNYENNEKKIMKQMRNCSYLSTA